jgi:hypothetical protein
VLKNLRTSTKLFLLCGMFVGAILLATYSLIGEKQIAIRFAQKELVGAQYLEALRRVYAIILDDTGLQDSEKPALGTLAIATPQLPRTAKLAHDFAPTIGSLSSGLSGGERRVLVIGALAKARDLAAQLGDESNLALDPDLDSYYLQNIAVKGVPTLLSEIGELHSLLHATSQTNPRVGRRSSHTTDTAGRNGSVNP